MTSDGASVLMTMGTSIHRLRYLVSDEVEITRYDRKSLKAINDNQRVLYQPLIRNVLSPRYTRRNVYLESPGPGLNWTFLDNFIAGNHSGFNDVSRFWRTRFVLVPVEVAPASTQRSLPQINEKDSPEEIRLEGIKKLTQLWQRNRYIPLEVRRTQSHMVKRMDANPLSIEFQTRDPSAVVAAGLDNSLVLRDEPAEFSTHLFESTGTYRTSDIEVLKLDKIAQDLQGEHGIRILNRWWHLTQYKNSFVGSDFTSWLLRNFADLDDREHAVRFGNQLMQRGFFRHVKNKHPLRDGNFFYQLAPEYITRPESRAGWFGTLRNERLAARDSEDDSGEETPIRHVALSNVMPYDVDPRKRSDRAEVVNLHYDRLHNPDNCYHIRIEWMNVTAKLIEDAINSWASTVENYGLRLVEVPIAEASRVSESHPFRAPCKIRLAHPPPKAQPRQPPFDLATLSPQGPGDKFFYHKALLRKLDFSLDYEAASCFPQTVNITYSWGKPDYRYTQYVHKSGVLLAQITDEGDFLLLANRLFNNRTANRDAAKFKKGGYDRRFGRSANTTHAKKNVLEHLRTAEQLKDEVKAFCRNQRQLIKFYKEVSKPRMAPSPHLGPLLDAILPLASSVALRDGSPSPARTGPVWTVPSPSIRPRSTAEERHVER